ncbi:MAG TPA: hypothetical protein ENI39_02215 [Anaerolineae bacterium]|nr:hypothetical protein [Anaerolineae bacterium]
MQEERKGERTRAMKTAAMLLLLAFLLSCRAPTAPSPTPTFPPDTCTLYLPGIAGGATTAPSPTSLSPVPSPSAPTPLPPPVFKPGAGVQVHLFASDPSQTLRWAQGLGVEWVKQQVDWNLIEHGPGDFEWEPLDRAVNLCDGFGFRLLVSVVNAPEYLRSEPTGFGPPADYAEFRRFMRQMAERYRGRVDAYELWNEANLAREWQGDTLDPARFAALVVEGAQGVRAGDPGALVLSGAPGVTGINDGVTAIDDRAFLRGMLAAGLAQWVDGIGVHPYGFANPPEASARDPQQTAPSHNDHPSFFFRDTLEDYRAIMLEYGAGSLPLWVTEFGWPSVEGMGDMDTTGWEYARHISEQQQADYIVRAFKIGLATPWVGPMCLWNLNVSVIYGNTRPESAYSLLRPDGSFRPAYIALRLAAPP